MTNELQIPRQRDGEQKAVWAEPQNDAMNSLENISLEAVINVLIKRGICTEAELRAEQNRLETSDFRSQTVEEAAYFQPVQTYSARAERHRHADDNRVRRWAAKYVWSRKIGGLFFGWKWHRKKSE